MKNNVESEALEIAESVLNAFDSEETDSTESDSEDNEEISYSEVNNNTSYDYTSYLENISNYLRFNSAVLVAVIILFGLIMGLTRHD